MNLYGIMSDEVEAYWPLILPLLEKPFVRMKMYLDYDIEYVLEQIKAAKMQCWVAHEKDEVIAVFITQILVRPKRKILYVPFIGAKRGTIKHWIGALDYFKAFAAETGCDVVKGIGRKGWERELCPDSVKLEYEFKV